MPSADTVRPTKLYRLITPGICRYTSPMKDIEPGAILWLHGSRPSTLGGYIGTFSETYVQMNGHSPRAGTFTMSLEHVEPVY